MQQDSFVDLDSPLKATGAWPDTTPCGVASRTRDLGLVYVGAPYVQHVLGCSQSRAYQHLQRATGKTGHRGLLRARREVWDAYARRLCGADALQRRGAVASDN